MKTNSKHPLTDKFAQSLTDAKVPASRCWSHWYDASAKLEQQYHEVAKRCERLTDAVNEVLRHRTEDKDGNYLCWIGEGTFIKCEDALKSTEELEKQEAERNAIKL